jgi:hypothetical protein
MPEPKFSRLAQLEKNPNLAANYREKAMQPEGMAENQFNKQDYEEYMRIRDHYYAK